MNLTNECIQFALSVCGESTNGSECSPVEKSQGETQQLLFNNVITNRYMDQLTPLHTF